MASQKVLFISSENVREIFRRKMTLVYRDAVERFSQYESLFKDILEFDKVEIGKNFSKADIISKLQALLRCLFIDPASSCLLLRLPSCTPRTPGTRFQS
jgi:hypothetical protein